MSVGSSVDFVPYGDLPSNGDNMVSIPLVLVLCLATASADDFNYDDHGEDWTGTCATGKSQSPINIQGYSSVNGSDSAYRPLTLAYTAQTVFTPDIEGHNYKITGSFGTLTAVDVPKSNNYTYAVMQFHFHAPSEHELNGTQYPLEMHIVHSLTPSSPVNPLGYAVLGVFFQEGKENAFLASVQAANPTSIDLHTLFSETSVDHYYMYQGSLTTPPCTEVVNWYVHGTVFTASAAQIKVFTDMWALNPAFADGNGNNREIQPLNGRTLLEYDDSASALGLFGFFLGLVIVA